MSTATDSTKSKFNFVEYDGELEEMNLTGMPYAMQIENMANFIGEWYRTEDHKPVVIEQGRIIPLSVNMAQYRISEELTKAGKQFTKSSGKNMVKLEPIPPGHMESILNEYEAPILKGIINIPIFNSEWKLISTKGYDPISQYYIDPKNINIIDMTLEEAKEELKTLCIDMLFKDPVADYANYIGYLLTPMIQTAVNRRMSPYTVFRKNTRGTGATAAVNVLGYIYEGYAVPSAPTAKSDDAEMRKLLTSSLKKGWRYINFDEQAGTIQATPITQYLTSATWLDRILGGSETFTYENPGMMLIGTGNNTMIGHDMARRVSLIEFYTKLEHPELRPFKRAENLEIYVPANRSRIFSALYTLVNNWSKVPGNNLIGDFESVVTVISGILRDAKIEGYQANRKSIAVIDMNANEQAHFYEVLYDIQGTALVHRNEYLTSKQIAELITHGGPLAGAIPALKHKEITEAARSGNVNAISRWLSKMVGQNKNGYIMEDTTDGHLKVKMFHILKVN